MSSPPEKDGIDRLSRSKVRQYHLLLNEPRAKLAGVSLSFLLLLQIAFVPVGQSAARAGRASRQSPRRARCNAPLSLRPATNSPPRRAPPCPLEARAVTRPAILAERATRPEAECVAERLATPHRTPEAGRAAHFGSAGADCAASREPAFVQGLDNFERVDREGGNGGRGCSVLSSILAIVVHGGHLGSRPSSPRVG